MSTITFAPNAAGTGIFTLAAPAINTNHTLIMPDASGNFVVDSAVQTLTNKTLTAPTINGGVISDTPIRGGVITAMTALDSTSGTSIQFTDIPDWVRRITFLMQSVSMNASTYIQIQVGTAAGFATSEYLGAVGGANFTAGFGVSASASGTTVVHGMMTIMNLSGNTWVAGMSGGFSSSAASSTGGGSVSLSGVLDRVRLTTVSGTAVFDSGSVNVMLEG